MIPKYSIPMGTGYIKRQYHLEGKDPVYTKIWDLMHDPINGALFFLYNCVWVNKNGLTKFTSRPYQREMIFNYLHFKNVVSLFSRQAGKTTTSSAYILWYALTFPNKDILVTSYTEKSAIEIMNMIKFIYEHCPDFIKIPIVENNKTQIKFTNGSRIFCRPTTTRAARGLSPAIIYCDEFAFVGNGDSASKVLEKQREFFSAISPALSTSHGSLFITSTPQSQTDMFYQIWSGAINKLDDNNLELPPHWVIEENNELYINQNLFTTKEEAENWIKQQSKPEIYKVVKKEPTGNNGFISQLADWTQDPEKDEAWATNEKKRVGIEMFEREYCCISGNSMIYLKNKNFIENISMQELYRRLDNESNARTISNNKGFM